MRVLSVILLGIFVSVHGAQQVSLESYASGFDSIPIAVVKFSGTGALPSGDEPWRVIADDLAFSARFEVSRPLGADTAALHAANIGIYIDGAYSISGDQITFDCMLRDARTKAQLLGKQFKGDAGQLRPMAHRFANRVLESLSGDKGYFESSIVFVRDEGQVKNLWAADFDGHRARQITRTKTVNIFPACIDASTILWVSYGRNKPDIVHGSLSGGNGSVIFKSRYVETSPDVSRIDGSIAFASSRSGSFDIYTSGIDGQNLKRLTFDKAISTAPCWSPNGYQIAYTSDHTGQPQIFVMDADGANVRRLTYDGTYQDSPAWSPRGDRIAYSSLRGGKFDIWTINTDGSGVFQVTSLGGHNEYPVWSPDGQQIMFFNRIGAKNDIYVVKADGSKLKRVTTFGNAKMPCWMVPPASVQ